MSKGVIDNDRIQDLPDLVDRCPIKCRTIRPGQLGCILHRASIAEHGRM